MKNMMILAAILIAGGFAGCATTGTDAPVIPTVFDQDCKIYEDVGATPENSLICKLIKNPCVAQKLLGLPVKVGVVWKPEYAALFEEWADKIQMIIEVGVTYQTLQDIVLVQVAKLNKGAGMGLLIISDGIFVFGAHPELIGPIDKKLLLMSLEDLRAQVARMAILAGQ
jgi:hypothetical protein